METQISQEIKHEKYSSLLLYNFPCIYLKLNEESEDNVVKDYSGFKRHAKIIGECTKSLEKKTFSPICFQGNAYIDCGQSLRWLAQNQNPVVHEMTITAIIKLPSCLQPNNESEEYSNSIFMEHAQFQGCYYKNGFLIFWHFYTGTQNVSIAVPVATLLDQWIHIGWVLDGTQLIAYVNGICHRSPPFTLARPGSSGGPLLIGGKYSSSHLDCQPSPSWTTSIIHFAAFPRALSHKEIKTLIATAGLHDHSI